MTRVSTFFARLAGQREYAVSALLVLMLVIVAAVNPSFLAPGNLRDILVKSIDVLTNFTGTKPLGMVVPDSSE